jgi:hypothetical protein
LSMRTISAPLTFKWPSPQGATLISSSNSNSRKELLRRCPLPGGHVLVCFPFQLRESHLTSCRWMLACPRQPVARLSADEHWQRDSRRGRAIPDHRGQPSVAIRMCLNMVGIAVDGGVAKASRSTPA